MTFAGVFFFDSQGCNLVHTFFKEWLKKIRVCKVVQIVQVCMETRTVCLGYYSRLNVLKIRVWVEKEAANSKRKINV